MQRTPVKSSNLKSVGYEEDKRTLEVEFSNGTIYQYSPILPEAHKALLSAQSIGGYFNTNIRSNTTVTATKIK